MTEAAKALIASVKEAPRSVEDLDKEALREAMSLNAVRPSADGKIVPLELPNFIEPGGKFVFEGERMKDVIQTWSDTSFIKNIQIGNDSGKKSELTVSKEVDEPFAVISVRDKICAYITLAQSTAHPWTIDEDEPDVRQLNVTTLCAPNEDGRMLFIPGWRKEKTGGPTFGDTGLSLRHFRSAVISVCWKALQQTETPRVYLTTPEKIRLQSATISKTVPVGEDLYEINSQKGSSEVVAFKNGTEIAKAILEKASILGSFSLTIRFVDKLLHEEKQIVENLIDAAISSTKRAQKGMRTTAFDAL